MKEENALNENLTINNEQLDQVVGGTGYDWNTKYKEEIYNQAGVSTHLYLLKKNKFWIKDSQGNDRAITYEQANVAVSLWQHSDHIQPTYEDVIAHQDS